MVHDLAASQIQEAWRLAVLRHGAKALVADRRRARDEAMMEVRMMSLGRQKNMVEELAAMSIQAASRGAATRRAISAMQVQDEAGHDEPAPQRTTPRDEQDTAALNEAATTVQATFRGASTRRALPAEDDAAVRAAEPGALTPHAKLEAPDAAQLERALLTACASGDLHAIHVLIRDHGANLNAADDKGNGPLMIAAAAGHLDVVKYLAPEGASLVVPNFAGWTPLHRACFNGHLDVVNWMLGGDEQASAHPNAGGGLPSLTVANHYGSTPLHVAIPNGHRKVVQTLVEKGAALEARNASGDTPLHFAVVCRQRSVVELLLEMGADASIPNDEGSRPADTAVATGQQELAQLLAKAATRAVTSASGRGTRSKSTRARPLSAPADARVPSGTTAASVRRKGRSSASRKSSGDSFRSVGSGNKSIASTASGTRRSKKTPSLGELEKRLFRGSPAPPARQALVGRAWRGASEATCTSVDLRPHEAATVLDVLGLELDSPPVRPPPGSTVPPAELVRLRLDDAARTTADLAAARAHLEGEGETENGTDSGWRGGGFGRGASTLVAVEAKHGKTARKKLLTLIRNPESGAAAFVADHPGVSGWSVATGRAFLQDILELPAERLPPNAETNGAALLAIDEKYAVEDPSIAALPSILKARLLFHCELLRKISAAEEADSKRALAQAEQWEREAAKAAAREKAREEARAEGWLPMSSAKKATRKHPASAGVVASAERQQSSQLPKSDSKSSKRSRAKKLKSDSAKVGNLAVAATDKVSASAMGPSADEGGWLGDGFDSYPGLRVQVAQFGDLVESLKSASSTTLAPAELTMARRSAGSRGTIITGDGAGASQLTVQLDDGLEARLPLAALYALPRVVLHPAQLRTGATARIVHARWLRQLLLGAENAFDSDTNVEALSERLGGALVTVSGLEELQSKHRVHVTATDGFEAMLPQDSLVPPPKNAHAVKLLKGRGSLTAGAGPREISPEAGAPGYEKRFAAAVAAPVKVHQKQSKIPSKGSVNGRSLYRDTSGGTGSASSAANMSTLLDPSVRDYEAIQGNLQDGETFRKTIVPMVAVGPDVPPERLEHAFPPAPRVPTAPGKVPEEMLSDGRVQAGAAVDISVTGSGLAVYPSGASAHDAHGVEGRGTYNRAAAQPKRQRPKTAGPQRQRKDWAPVNMKIFGFKDLEASDSFPLSRGALDDDEGTAEGFGDDFDVDGGADDPRFPHPWKPAGSGKNAIDAIYNPASNANGAPATNDVNDASEAELQPRTPIRRRPASARTRRPNGATDQAGGAAWAAVRGSGDRPLTAGISKRGIRDMPAEGLQRSTSDLTKRQLTPQEQALLASEAIKMDKSGRAVWRPAGSGKAAIDAIYNPVAASNLGLRHSPSEDDLAAMTAEQSRENNEPYVPAPYASSGRAFPAGSVWTRSDENLHALQTVENEVTSRISPAAQDSEDEGDGDNPTWTEAKRASSTAAPAVDDPVARLSQASAAIPDRDLRERLQRMDEEIAERHAAQSNEFHSRQYSERAKENVARSDDLARGGGALDGRVAAMEKELIEREAELRDGTAPAPKSKNEAAAEKHRMTLMEETDERLRRQMARMDEQMHKKEQEIREALNRQKRIIAEGKKMGPSGGRRGGAGTRGAQGNNRGRFGRPANNQNSNPNRMSDAPEVVQEMHEATHRRLFQNDVARRVDEKLERDKGLEEKSWRAAEAEVADLAAAMDEIANEMARDKEREGELRTKVREMNRAQDRIERRTSELQASLGRVKLSGRDGPGRVAKQEDVLAELMLEHEAQAKEVNSVEARLEVLRNHVCGHNVQSDPTVLQGFDKDAKLAHGIERRHQVMRTRKRALEKAVVDVDKALKEQIVRHGEQASQLAVAEMTLKAMKAVASGERE